MYPSFVACSKKKLVPSDFSYLQALLKTVQGTGFNIKKIKVFNIIIKLF